MQKNDQSMFRIRFGWVSFALTLGLAGAMNYGTEAHAQQQVNTIHYDQIIKGGPYQNTAGHTTQFYNTKGLWLKSGTTITGREVNSQGVETGNGGNFWLNSPGGVVRVDGNIDVRSANQNGGNVRIDAAYMYQSGNIWATGGANGGGVNINVNSATFTPTARIDVSGTNTSTGIGAGGQIKINSTGILDIQKGAVMQANGYNGSGNANIIDIASGLVNNSGIIRADAAQGNTNQGGTIRLTAAGPINLQPVADAIYKSCIVFTPCEGKAIIQSLRTIGLQFPPETRNAIINAGTISANGSSGSGDDFGGKGGNISMNAIRVWNKNLIQANGGQGGQGGGGGGNIASTSRIFQNNGLISANGGVGASGRPLGGSFGGGGGTITIKTNIGNLQWLNTGTIQANGGDGKNLNGNGGNGGKLDLAADNTNNTSNMGKLEANGGNGNGDLFSSGGAGGTITATNIPDQGGGTRTTSTGNK